MDFVYKSVSEFVGIDISSEMSLEGFEASLRSMIESTTKASAQSDSSEEFQKNLIANFLHKHFDYECNVLGKADLAIYDEGIAKVLFEVKSTQNKAEFVKSPQIPHPKSLPQGEGLAKDSPSFVRGDSQNSPSLAEGARGWVKSSNDAWSLESKAFYESILYFLREVKREKNNNIKHIILLHHAGILCDKSKGLSRAIYRKCRQSNPKAHRHRV
ncbi:DUF7149 domain-containing protein [Helicobacter sp. 23-1046]